MTNPWTEWSAPAKVNLFLEVVGRREDGYHELRTVYQALDLTDTLRVRRSEDGACTVRVTEGVAPAGEANLVHRAWRALVARVPRVGGVTIELDKRIPSEAGLGGGSSDAAAAIVAAAHVWEVSVSAAAAEAVAAEIGSDAAFFVRGGTQLGEGRGERLTPWPGLTKGCFVVAKPPFGLATPAVYAQAAGRALTPPGDALTLLRLGLTREEPQEVGSGVFNALEGPAFSLRPALVGLKRKLLGNAWGGALSGSGSALFAYFADDVAARATADELADEVAFVVIAKPLADGVHLV